MRKITLALLLVVVFTLAGCRQAEGTTSENVNIEVAVTPEEPAVGDAMLLVTVTDAEGNPINDATVAVRGDMSHAGMVPVIPAEISDAEDGVYTFEDFEWTMGGEWFVEVTVTLTNGETATERFEYTVSGEMDMEDMDEMDMDSTEEMDMDGMDMDATEEIDMDMTEEAE